MKESRIYLDHKLINICHNEYTLFCNMCNYINIYGKERVTLKRLDEITNDKEKEEWLKSL
ncbi:TPA: hypothetical protein N2D16_002697 [Clostridium botulinum]|nr:hypothetical protein [Clostridium botulinum]